MKLHAKAALTLKQRQEVKRLHFEDHLSIRTLAKRFGVNPTTIQRWIHRESPGDRTTAPIIPHGVITPAYQEAVLNYRREHRNHGPIRIAFELKEEFSFANRGTVLRILQEAKLTRPPGKSKPANHIPTGKHRIQLDIQQLPAVEGDKGFEYKISAIHLATRVKYSEIRRDCQSETIAQVLRRALDQLPPLFSFSQTTPWSSP
jgi:transposase